MKNKTVIVTGGSSGMGKYMAKRFAEAGANVVITGRNPERLEAAKAEIETANGQVLTIQMDVREIEHVKHMLNETLSTFGQVDFLVNNAAGNFICPAEQLSANGWNSVINIVLNGTFYCSSEVGKYWIEKGIKGSIINMVATYAWDAGAGVIHSAAAKAGVLSMTRTLAVEWGRKYGIRVNAIAPGPIERTGGLTGCGSRRKLQEGHFKVYRLAGLGSRRKLQNWPSSFSQNMQVILMGNASQWMAASG